jgi:DNA-binding NarL/FixJ family response regulator
VLSIIRVSICFHNRLLRDSIARILGKRTEFEVLPLAPSDFAENPEATNSSDVVLLDSLEHLYGATSSGRIAFGRSSPKYVLLAMEDDASHFLRAVRKGAWGYVLQDASAADVVAAIRTVADGQAVCPPQYTRVLFEYIATQTKEMPNSRKRARWGLTRREQQLIPLIERGLSNKEIADHLHLSEQTVKNHVHRILRKTGASDRLSISEACRESFAPFGTESSTEPKTDSARVPS